MSLIVQKYGGSSLASTEAIRTVADSIVERFRQGDALVVVVSAMGKTTEDLLTKARDISGAPCQRELDMLVTAGERISMALLSMAIQAAGEEAISFTGSQSGIITTNDHQEAKIIEIRPQRIQEQLEAGKIVIVAGFQGVSLEREVTTLGRGGSDTSAVALAAALGADACEIYSDVDGVYSADPNLCEQAQHLPQLSYEQMQSMALFGAKVLNAEAAAFAQRAQIEIRARKTGGGVRESLISELGQEKFTVTAVAGLKHVSRCVADGGSDSAARFLSHLGTARLLALHATERVEVWVDRTNIPGQQTATLDALAQDHGFDTTDCSMVTLVGVRAGEQISATQKTLDLLKEASLETLGTNYSDGNLSLLITRDDYEQVVDLVHQCFFAAK